MSGYRMWQEYFSENVKWRSCLSLGEICFSPGAPVQILVHLGSLRIYFWQVIAFRLIIKILKHLKFTKLTFKRSLSHSEREMSIVHWYFLSISCPVILICHQSTWNIRLRLFSIIAQIILCTSHFVTKFVPSLQCNYNLNIHA